jgi:hypothetical protein
MRESQAWLGEALTELSKCVVVGKTQAKFHTSAFNDWEKW